MAIQTTYGQPSPYPPVIDAKVVAQNTRDALHHHVQSIEAQFPICRTILEAAWDAANRKEAEYVHDCSDLPISDINAFEVELVLRAKGFDAHFDAKTREMKVSWAHKL